VHGGERASHFDAVQAVLRVLRDLEEEAAEVRRIELALQEKTWRSHREHGEPEEPDEHGQDDGGRELAEVLAPPAHRQHGDQEERHREIHVVHEREKVGRWDRNELPYPLRRLQAKQRAIPGQHGRIQAIVPNETGIHP